MWSTGRWGSDSVLDTEKKVVSIYVNGNLTDSKTLHMEASWSIHDFLVAASQRLEMVPTAKFCFGSDGMEIDDCMMIEDNDILFISQHDEYLPPAAPADSPVAASHRRSSTDSSAPLPTTIGGYLVGKFLGKGGFGEVRVGEHQVTGERVALKFLRKADMLTMGAAERTTTEIQCLTALRHANIIRLYSHTESTQHVVLVFEIMEGGDLYRFLIARGSTAQAVALPEDQARPVFQQLVNALSYAHNQHICHRDLKLENVLLKGEGSLAVVKIADFGLSDFYRPGAVMKASCGTLCFQSPETFKSSASAGPPLDVWSLGVILFSVLCGRLPWEGMDLHGTKRPREAIIRSKILKGQFKVSEGLSVEAKDLIRCMLRLDPADRASVSEVFSHCWLQSHSLDSVPAAPLASPAFTRLAPSPSPVPSSSSPLLVPADAAASAASASATSGSRLSQRAGLDSSSGKTDQQDFTPPGNGTGTGSGRLSGSFGMDSSLTPPSPCTSSPSTPRPGTGSGSGSGSGLLLDGLGSSSAELAALQAQPSPSSSSSPAPDATVIREPSFKLVPLRRTPSSRPDANDQPSSSSSSSSLPYSSSAGSSSPVPPSPYLPVSPGALLCAGAGARDSIDSLLDAPAAPFSRAGGVGSGGSGFASPVGSPSALAVGRKSIRGSTSGSAAASGEGVGVVLRSQSEKLGGFGSGSNSSSNNNRSSSNSSSSNSNSSSGSNSGKMPREQQRSGGSNTLATAGSAAMAGGARGSSSNGAASAGSGVLSSLTKSFAQLLTGPEGGAARR